MKILSEIASMIGGLLGMLLAVLTVWGIGLCIWGCLAFLVSFWTDRSLDYWVSYSNGTATDVPHWVSFVASLLLPLALVANIVSEVARYFV